MPEQPRRPLVIRFGAFGDMVLMIPLLKFLHQRYGALCDVISSGPWTDPLLQRVPGIGERFYLTSRRAPYWFNRSQQQLVAWLRRRPAGPVYVFETDEKTLSLLRRARIDPSWICTLRDFPRQPGEHILAHTGRLARATPRALEPSQEANRSAAPGPDSRPRLTDTDRRDCAAWLEQRGLAGAPLVLIQAGNKKTMKRGRRRRVTNVDYWPEANWARVIAGVHASLPEARVILCGAPAERALAEDIMALLPAGRERVTIATDDLPIPRLLALQERAHSLISVNTGPAHSAAAMGCPLLVMFTRHAHRAPDLYAPVSTGAPIRILQPDAALADPTLASITPETVVAAWRELVQRLP
jgi:heptosyltransferase-2/heptosyltransferase-3